MLPILLMIDEITQEDERELLRRLFFTYAPKMKLLAQSILKNEADAEDAAQEAFLKAYTSLADFRGDSRFSVWLYRLTNNICIDMLRKNKRAVIVSLQTEDDDGEETEIAIPDERYSPERLAERAADRDAVRTALAALPEGAARNICRIVLTGETDRAPNPAALRAALEGQVFAMQLRDETRARRDLWARAGEGTLRGQFLAQLKQKYDAAGSDRDRETIVMAARWGLAALDHDEEVVTL